MNLSDLQSALMVMGQRIKTADEAADVIYRMLNDLAEIDLKAVRDAQIAVGMDRALAHAQCKRMIEFRATTKALFDKMASELDCMRTQQSTMAHEVGEAVRRHRSRTFS